MAKRSDSITDDQTLLEEADAAVRGFRETIRATQQCNKDLLEGLTINETFENGHLTLKAAEKIGISQEDFQMLRTIPDEVAQKINDDIFDIQVNNLLKKTGPEIIERYKNSLSAEQLAALEQAMPSIMIYTKDMKNCVKEHLEEPITPLNTPSNPRDLKGFELK